MFRNKIFRLCLSCFLLISLPVRSQPDSDGVNRLNIKISPQHLFINGFVLDVERPLPKHPRQSVIFSPRVYAGQTYTLDFLGGRRREPSDNSKVAGLGLEVQHRLYTTRHTDVARERVYLAYGLNLHHFDWRFNRPGWAEELGDDGLYYFRHRQRPYHQKINQWGAVAMFGAQNPLITKRLLWDIFLGLGYKNSHVQTNYSSAGLNENFLDFGFTGVYFLAGLKVGVAL